MAEKKRLKEIHLVCPEGRFVEDETDTQFKSGKWSVNKSHLESRQGDIRFALHRSRKDPSYLQGLVVDWEVVLVKERKRPNRIQFTVRKTKQPLPWHGQSSGEKGYKWEDT